MNKIIILFSLVSLMLADSNLMPNGSPNIAGFWEESSGRIWKSTQRGNLFTWVQERTNRVAKGVIVAKSPDNKSTWLVFITFDGKIHWELEFNEDFSTLTAKNDVYKRSNKQSSATKDQLYPEFTALTDSGLPTLYGMTFKEGNTAAVWIVQSQSSSGALLIKAQNEERFVNAYGVRDPQTKEYVIYVQFNDKDLRRIETYDIRKWPMPNKDVFSTTNQIIHLQ